MTTGSTKPARLLGYSEISAATGLRPHTLRVWATRGKLPRPDYRVGQTPVWLPETLTEFLKSHKKES